MLRVEVSNPFPLKDDLRPRGRITRPAVTHRERASALHREDHWLEDAGINSVVNGLHIESLVSLESLDVVLHGFERLGGMPLPIRALARDS